MAFQSGYFKLTMSLVMTVVFLISCGEKKEVSGALALPVVDPPNQKPDTTPSVTPLYVYSGEFQVVNGGLYKTFLEICSRCGTKRLIQTPFGDRYERYWTFWG